jgi:hypothetical protein
MIEVILSPEAFISCIAASISPISRAPFNAAACEVWEMLLARTALSALLFVWELISAMAVLICSIEAAELPAPSDNSWLRADISLAFLSMARASFCKLPIIRFRFSTIFCSALPNWSDAKSA